MKMQNEQQKPAAERKTFISFFWRVCGLRRSELPIHQWDILPALMPKAQTTGLHVVMATPGLLPPYLHLLPPHPECCNPSINNLIMYDNSHSKHPGSSPLEKQTDFSRELSATEMFINSAWATC